MWLIWEWHYLQRLCHADLLPRMEHAYWVQGLAFSPDGQRIVSAAGLPSGYGSDLHPAKTPGQVKVWEAGTGQLLGTLDGHPGAVWAVAYSSDGRRLASAGPDGSARLWDAATFRQQAVLPGRNEVHRLQFAPDGNTLAVSSPSVVQLWNLDGGREPLSLPVQGPWPSPLAFRFDGRLLLAKQAAEDSYSLQLYDTATGKVLRVFAAPFFPAALAFSPDGGRMAVSGRGGLRLCHAGSGQVLAELHGHSGPVLAVAFSPDGRQLASCGDDKTVRIWDVQTAAERAVLRGHTATVTSLAFSPAGTRLASGSRDATVRVWDPMRDPRATNLPGYQGEHLGNLTFAARGGTLLVLRHSDTTSQQRLRSWDTAQGRLVGGRDIPVVNDYRVPRGDSAFSADGCLLVAPAEEDPTVLKVWDTATGTEVTALHGHAGKITAAAFRRDGRQVASAAQAADKLAESPAVEVKIWDVETGREQRSFAVTAAWIDCLEFSPDGRHLATAGRRLTFDNSKAITSRQPEVTIYDATNGQELVRFAGPKGLVCCVAFSPDGQKLAAAGFDDRSVHVWDAASGRACFGSLAAFPGRVTGVAFSPDGKRLAATGYDSIVKLWDAATGGDVLTLRGFGAPSSGHYAFTGRVVFSPDGTRIAANTWDGSINVWDAGGKP